LNISFLSKRNAFNSVIGIACACVVGWQGQVHSQSAPAGAFPNWVLGRADAPITVLEYGSLTCAHCAQLANEVMPEIKRRYVDTGRVRFVFRPMPTPPIDLSVAMHVLTLCAGPTRYYPLVQAYFERQQQVFQAAVGETGPKGTLFAIAEDFGGLNYAAAEACLRDPVRLGQVRASVDAGTRAGVAGTPTLFVNGVLINVRAGQAHYEVADISNAIEAAARPRTAAPAKAKKR
jgi:protein-disulfide isomerase